MLLPEQISALSRCTYSVNQQRAASELAARTVQSASGSHGEQVSMLWEKVIVHCSVSLPAPFLSVAGSRWQGMAARHASLGCQEMSIITGTPWLSLSLSPLHKVPLYVLRDISPKSVHV